MKSTILQNWTDVISLGERYKSLHQKAEAHGLFLSWEWLTSWIATIQDKLLPYFIIIEDDNNNLVGVAPFYFSETQLFSISNYRTLRIAADHSTGFEYADFIVDPEQQTPALQALGNALRNNRSDWDLIWIPKVAGWTNSLDRISKAIQDYGSLPLNRRDALFSSIPLPDSISAYNSSFSSKRRNQQKRIEKKVLSDTTARFICCDSQDQLDHFLTALYTLHHKRRMLLNDPGTFIRRPSQLIFYNNFTPQALKNGWLRITALESQGEIQAIQLGYICGKAYLQMQEGFNPDYTDGAGNVLRLHVIKQCIEEGLTEYDFLGGFTEHKRRWGAQERSGHDVLIGNGGIKSSIPMKLEFWPSGRFLRQRELVS